MNSAAKTTDFFSYEALRTLSVNLTKFDSPTDYFDLVDELASDKRFTKKLPTPIEWSAPLIAGGSEYEANNAVEVFTSVGAVNRVFASDPRLWTYLALVTHREYMTQRWGWDNDDGFAGAISRRWLIPQAKARSMVRHGIARLWWIPNLTLDDNLDFPLSQSTSDPFAYSSWILDSEERIKSLFEGLIGRTPSVRWAAIKSLSSAPSYIPKRDGARELAKKINLEAGFRNLQTLSEDSLQNLVDDLMAEVVQQFDALKK